MSGPSDTLDNPANGKVGKGLSGEDHLLSQVLARASTARIAGRLNESEELYSRVLESPRFRAKGLHGIALVRAGQGRIRDAHRLIDEALNEYPDDPEFAFDKAILLMRGGQMREAIPHLSKAMRRRSLVADASFNLGTIYQGLGDAAAAVAQYRKAAKERPTFAEAHFNLGLALAATGDFESAAASYKKAASLKPNLANAHNNLGRALEALRKPDQALAAYEQALKVQPDHAEAHSNLGALLTSKGQTARAIEHFGHALESRPTFAGAENNWGEALQRDGQFEAAMARYRRAVELQPDFAEAHNNLGAVLGTLRHFSDAIHHLKLALILRPDFAEAHNNLGTSLHELGRTGEAALSYERAIALNPEYAEAFVNKGNLLVEQGQIESGILDLERAIALDPSRPAFYRALTNFKKMERGEAHVPAMEALLREEQDLSDGDRTDLHFALGKAFEDLGEREKAFAHHVEGNALKRKHVGYDEGAALGALARHASVYSGDLIRRWAGRGCPSALPIFVVGMPRSGTTLVEQILSSSPQVFGAGELSEFEQAVVQELGSVDAITAAKLEQRPEALRRIGERYVASISALSRDADFIVDKQPMNFRLVGLIHLALPNARILHTCRDPMDTCLSCFSKLFKAGLEFTYDLRELGRYHRAYRAATEHWRTVIPGSALLDVAYEEVTRDFERQSRRILEHCRLEWTEGCSSYWKTKRSVRTASAAQVRKPIYTSSVGRSRALAEQLKSLIEEL